MPLAAEGFTPAPSRRHRLPGDRGCDGKATFRSRAEARSRLRGFRRAADTGRVQRPQRLDLLEVYWCSGHAGYHFGHRREPPPDAPRPTT